MSLSRKDWLASFSLVIISILTVFDLFVNIGRSANMDGLVHITTIAQFTQAFLDGDFPVTWLDGFANYGMPIGIVAHQFPTYIGLLFNLFVHDPVLSFNLVSLIAVILSTILMYSFLRIYFSEELAFTGAFLINLAPYRIINLYIRGAIPETFSLIFLPLVLISLYRIIIKRSYRSFFLLTLAFTSLMVTHPMMLVTYAFIFVPYAVFLFLTTQDVRNWKTLISRDRLVEPVLVGLSGLISLMIAAYYVLPLLLEIKYFNYGYEKNHLVANHFMGLKNFFTDDWYYFYQSDIFPRGHFIHAGLPEVLLVIVSLGYIMGTRITGRVRGKVTFLEYVVVSALLLILFMTSFAEPVYRLVPFLGNIQFPWRLFSAFIVLPPFILIYFLRNTKRYWLLLVIIVGFALLRFPQLYGKNYTNYPLSAYTFTPLNLHSNNMNTVWTATTDEYPMKVQQIDIIGGEGSIREQEVHNSWRRYEVSAQTPLKLVDYTFFFPGWKVYIDTSEVPIQFQDPNYRGVITYDVPQGDHTVLVQFEDTKIRLLGKMISVIGIILLGTIWIFRKRIGRAFQTLYYKRVRDL